MEAAAHCPGLARRGAGDGGPVDRDGRLGLPAEHQLDGDRDQPFVALGHDHVAAGQAYAAPGRGARRLQQQVHVAVTGNHNDFGVGIFVLNFAEEFDAVHYRHFNVSQDNWRVLPVEYLDSILTVFSCQYLVAKIG